MKQSGIYTILFKKWGSTPDKIMLIDETQTCTFEQFERMVDVVSAQLPVQARRIGLVMSHSFWLIAAIFAILKKGAAYIPAEPSFPKKRIAFMMQDAQADCILSDIPLDLPSVIPFDPNAAPVCTQNCSQGDDLAYILYTSGSTGLPKGVGIYQRNIAHYAYAFQQEFHLNGSDIMLQNSVCSFDIFTEEVFASLLNGAALAIPDEDSKKDVHALMDFVNRKGVTILSAFPYLIMDLNELESIPESLRLLISGGDVLRETYIDHLKDHIKIYNTYGPSETTVCASYFRADNAQALSDGTYPIGKAVDGVQIEILDENLQPVPDGVSGEICILGDGIGAGYIGERKKENEAFVHLDNGQILYRSGDLGYVLPDGNLAFEHRKDSQVMILGRRVEPIEVEGVLCSCPDIETAVVLPCMDEDSLSYLTAYIVLEDVRTPLSSILAYMKQFLPPYMIPEYFVRMEQIPLNANGKVDKAALPVVMKVSAIQ